MEQPGYIFASLAEMSSNKSVASSISPKSISDLEHPDISPDWTMFYTLAGENAFGTGSNANLPSAIEHYRRKVHAGSNKELDGHVRELAAGQLDVNEGLERLEALRARGLPAPVVGGSTGCDVEGHRFRRIMKSYKERRLIVVMAEALYNQGSRNFMAEHHGPILGERKGKKPVRFQTVDSPVTPTPPEAFMTGRAVPASQLVPPEGARIPGEPTHKEPMYPALLHHQVQPGDLSDDDDASCGEDEDSDTTTGRAHHQARIDGCVSQSAAEQARRMRTAERIAQRAKEVKELAEAHAKAAAEDEAADASYVFRGKIDATATRRATRGNPNVETMLMLHHLPLHLTQSAATAKRLQQTRILNIEASRQGIKLVPNWVANHAGSPDPPLETHACTPGVMDNLCINCGRLHAVYNAVLRRDETSYVHCPYQWGEHCIQLFEKEQARAERRAAKAAKAERKRMHASFLEDLTDTLPLNYLDLVTRADEHFKVTACCNDDPIDLSELRNCLEAIHEQVAAYKQLESRLAKAVRDRQSRSSEINDHDDVPRHEHRRPASFPDVTRHGTSAGFTTSVDGDRAPASSPRSARVSGAFTHFTTATDGDALSHLSTADRQRDPTSGFCAPRTSANKPPTAVNTHVQSHIPRAQPRASTPAHYLGFTEGHVERLLTDSPLRTEHAVRTPHLTVDPGSTVASRIKKRNVLG
jgi:hypothetical protein